LANEHAVVAFVGGAQIRIRFRVDLDVLDALALADSLAARLIVEPLHLVTRARQHIEQAFGIADAALVVILATPLREHAGHGDFGGSAAGSDIVERDHVETGQLRIRLAAIAEIPGT